MTVHRTSLETHAASRTSSGTNVTVIALAITTGLILVAVAIYAAIALAGKRGMFQHPTSRNEMPEWMCDMVMVE
jgi:uncharacterized membrane protein YjjB (DUF3815 family)